MSPKPTIILVHGAWHSPEYYDSVRKILTAHNYPSIAVALPSVGAVPALPDFSGDVQAIRTVVRQVVEEEEKEVVLLMHSYGGCPGAECLEGLGKKERAKEGKKGGVVRLVFMCAFVLGEGEQVVEDDAVEDPKWKVGRIYKDGHVMITDGRDRFYNDLDDQTAAYWVSRLRPQSVGAFRSKTSYAAWRYIPSTYLICEKDNAVVLAMQEVFAKRCMADTVERCDSSHSPFLSRPEYVVDVIRRASGGEV